MISAIESKRAMVAIHRAIASVRADRFVFVGGGIVPLLITDPAASPVRPTKDIDVVIEIVSAGDYSFARRDLLGAGFIDDMSCDKPACALFFGEWMVDILPTQPNIVVGGGNRWFTHAVHAAEPMDVDGTIIWRASAPVFIATKLEAWMSRGKTQNGAPDYFHQDLEDIVAVMDGRPELDREWASAPADVRLFIEATLAALLDSRDFINALPGHLNGDDTRARMLVGRLTAMLWPQP
jgi:predicted nucleotidyltransferase